ncbi:MAG: hypothetical protein ACTSRI_15235 [Promethearchaeota archaeon]
MAPKNKEDEIEKLTLVLSNIQNLYHKKKEQLEDLRLEISELKEILNSLNIIIANKSFYSANEIYSKSLKKLDKEHEESYFEANIQKEKVKGTNIKRKIFSNAKDKEGQLLGILNFIDFNRIEIKFMTPELAAIKEASEDFINTFVKGALFKIKEKNPNLKLKYNFYKNTDMIESIEITNLNSIEDYDLITLKVRQLLTG